jgi:T-complex protein 1 subunit delta
LEKIGTPVVLTDREALINAARTSLSSKVISQYAELFAPLAVDAVLKVIDPATAENVDLDDVKIVTRVGGTMDDTEMIDGLCFGKGFSKSGGIQTIKNPKIALIQFCLSAPKTDMENSVVISEYDQMDKILREERKYILKMCKWCMGRVCGVCGGGGRGCCWCVVWFGFGPTSTHSLLFGICVICR